MATVIMDSGRSAERRFFSSMAIVMIVLVLIGFAPSFYLRGIVHYPRPSPTLNPLIILHGAMFTLWLMIFWTQTRLIAAGRRDLHMRLGIGGMAVAVAMIPLMYLTSVGLVARASAPPFTTPLAWTAVPLATLLAYILLVYLGWRYRKDARAHKRLMLSAALLLMSPAVGRFPIAPPVLVGHAAQEFLGWCTFIPLFVYDRRSLGRLHWATKLGAALAAAAILLGIAGILIPGWAEIAASLPGV